MKAFLPPLRAVQAFEAFGRIGSVSGAARELGVTAGAISQQIKILEEYLEISLIRKDGRRASLSSDAKLYHEFVSAGFDKLRLAHQVLIQQQAGADVTVSGLPTLLQKWLNPRIHLFQADTEEVVIRLEATHAEPDPQMLDRIFRLTYGSVAETFAHSRPLFTDYCFPVCSPDFLERHGRSMKSDGFGTLPWIDIDWGPAYATVPRLRDWLTLHGLSGPNQKPVAVHSLSSLALEGAVAGQGIALAQSSFAAVDLDLGRLVRLSEAVIAMPEPYFVCWGRSTLDTEDAKRFLNWLLAEARELVG